MSDVSAGRSQGARPSSGHLHREIRSQATGVASIAGRAEEIIETCGAALDRDRLSALIVAARGTSDNAARYLQYIAGVRCALPVALAAPSLQTVYGVEPLFRDVAVLGISQSGSSPDIVGVVRSANAQSVPTLAITNDAGSDLAHAAATVIDLGLAPERAVAATGTYTATLATLALLVTALDRDPCARARAVAELALLPELMHRTTEAAEPAVAALDAEPLPGHMVVVGRGLNYSTAFEVAIKVRELTRTVAEAFSPADLLHGPIAALGPQTTVVLIAPDEPSRASVADLVPRLRATGARLLMIGDDAALGAACDAVLPVAGGVPGWLTPLAAVIPGQLLAERLALRAGLDPDDPVGLSKVTRTR